MRKFSKLLATAAFAILATFSLAAQEMPVELCDGKLTVDVTDMATSADGTLLHTCYDITVKANAFDPCKSLVITPIVKNDGVKKVLQVIVVNGYGQVRSNRWLDSQIREVCDPNFISYYDMKEGEDLIIKTCCAGVAYEYWMDDNADFDITVQEVVYYPNNCIKNLCNNEFVCDVPYLSRPLVIDPVFLNIYDEPKLSEDVHYLRTKLFYPVNITKSVESYLGNTEALMLLKTLDQPNFDVTSINIEGWASPESTVKYNQPLSEKRAETVKQIIAGRYSFPESIYHIQGNGEYWDEVINVIKNSTNPTIDKVREKILAAIDDNSDLDQREAAIKKVSAAAYREIFKEAYPNSRFAGCEVQFKFKRMNRQDALIIYAIDPTKLTAEDYAYLLNEDYNPEIMDKALEIYPDYAALYAIAASKEYKNENYDKSIEFLQKAGDSIEINNNIASCYMMLGDYDNAKKYLDMTKGLYVYGSQSRELRKVYHNNRFYANMKK